jgi:hypothetical protein
VTYDEDTIAVPTTARTVITNTDERENVDPAFGAWSQPLGIALPSVLTSRHRSSVFHANGDEQLGFKLQSQFAQYQNADVVDGDENSTHLFHPLLHIPHLSPWLHQSPRTRSTIGVICAVAAVSMYISGLWREYFGLALYFIASSFGMLLLMQMIDRRLLWWLFQKFEIWYLASCLIVFAFTAIYGTCYSLDIPSDPSSWNHTQYLVSNLMLIVAYFLFGLGTINLDSVPFLCTRTKIVVLSSMIAVNCVLLLNARLYPDHYPEIPLCFVLWCSTTNQIRLTMITNITIFWLKYVVSLWCYGNRFVILNSAIDIDIISTQTRVQMGILPPTTS